MKKAFSPNVQPKKTDPEAARLLVDAKVKEAENQLAKGADPMATLQDTANSAIAIFDADPVGLINVLCLFWLNLWLNLKVKYKN